jgi:hypothetical protein
MKPKHIIHPGQVFGRLTAVKPVVADHASGFWECRCICGKTTTVVAAKLGAGRSRSCGCAKRPPLLRTHGDSHAGGKATPEYGAWRDMKQRCLNPKAKNYGRYGARGVTVCERWKASFEAFLEDMGRRPGPGYSLDRIDNDGNYEPSNCRWADKWQQANNRSDNRYLEIDGERLTLAQATERHGADYGMVRSRLLRGWDEKTAILTPSTASDRA